MMRIKEKRIKEKRINTFKFISIETERYILININGRDSFFEIKCFICNRFTIILTVRLLLLSFNLSGSWNTTLKIKNQRLMIRGNHTSSNRSNSTFIVKFYWAIISRYFPMFCLFKVMDFRINRVKYEQIILKFD